MAEFSLRATPEMLEGLDADARSASRGLTEDAARIREVASLLERYVTDDASAARIRELEEGAGALERLCGTLEELSRDVVRWTQIYEEAEQGFLASFRASLTAVRGQDDL